MTQENKELLLQDLCARLPYGVKCRQFKLDSQICTLSADLLYKVENIEPYFRSMSSMTEEERKEYNEYFFYGTSIGLISNTATAYELIDWLNAHHFDYRGLIEKGLAIEAPEEMYKK